MRTERYDIIIIGSGAGGGTMAHALADTGARILILERGDFVPQEDENWSPEAVWKHLRYQTTERWLDERGREFRPYTHYGVGGNTKFWGSVLYRLRREDFQAIEHVDGVSPAWPIDYDTLAPYYDRAERLYHVHGEHGDRSDRAAARPVSVRADPARRRRWRRSSSSCARRGCTRRRCRSGLLRPGRSRTAASSATPATRSRASCTRRARPTSAACARRCSSPNVDAVDQRAARGG